VILKEKKLTAKAVYGIFPANQINDDDIELNGRKRKPLQTFPAPTIKTKDAQILPCLILLRQKTMELPIIWAVLCDHGFWC
jgi:cobalamin-dependent methionine synthase I